MLTKWYARYSQKALVRWSQMPTWWIGFEQGIKIIWILVAPAVIDKCTRQIQTVCKWSCSWPSGITLGLNGAPVTSLPPAFWTFCNLFKVVIPYSWHYDIKLKYRRCMCYRLKSAFGEISLYSSNVSKLIVGPRAYTIGMPVRRKRSMGTRQSQPNRYSRISLLIPLEVNRDRTTALTIQCQRSYIVLVLKA